MKPEKKVKFWNIWMFSRNKYTLQQFIFMMDQLILQRVWLHRLQSYPTGKLTSAGFGINQWASTHQIFALKSLVEWNQHTWNCLISCPSFSTIVMSDPLPSFQYTCNVLFLALPSAHLKCPIPCPSFNTLEMSYSLPSFQHTRNILFFAFPSALVMSDPLSSLHYTSVQVPNSNSVDR